MIVKKVKIIYEIWSRGFQGEPFLSGIEITKRKADKLKKKIENSNPLLEVIIKPKMKLLKIPVFRKY